MKRISGPMVSVLLVFAVTLVPMLYGNLVVKRGGILDDSLLNEKDPFYIMDKRAESLLDRGLKTSDAVTLVVPVRSPTFAADLRFVQTLGEDLKTAFPEYGVLSLSVVPKYRDNGEELLNSPYINDAVLREMAADASGLAESQWRTEVVRDPSVYGILIGRNFDYAVVTLLLPRGFDEIAVFRRLAAFLEQRGIPWCEWFFKADIYPAGKYKDITVAGWAAACGLMDAALASDMVKLTSMGLLIAGVMLYFSLRSARQTLVAMITLAICLLWTRGSIGILQTLGVYVHERVYALLVYTAVIISGISFVERKFECYNEVRIGSPDCTCGQGWAATRGIVDGVIWITAINALANFGTLYQIGIRGILEVGALSALGIVYLLLLVLWFLPALHTLTGGEAVSSGVGADSVGAGCIETGDAETREAGVDSGGTRGPRSARTCGPSRQSVERLRAVGSLRPNRAADAWDRFLQRIVAACHLALDPDGRKPFQYSGKAMLAISFTAVPTVAAALMIASDHAPFVKKDFQFLHIRTRPLDYLPDTIVYRASEILNRQGNYGFDRIPVLVMPANRPGGVERGVEDPAFVARVDELARRIREIENVREVSSVVDTVKMISRESHGTPLPRTVGEIHDALQMIEWDLGPKIKEHFWYDEGVILFVSFSADDSNGAGDIVNSIIGLSRDAFADLDVLPFGKLLTYPRIDRYIREGKPWNAVSSLWMVAVICAGWIVRRNRSLQRASLSSLPDHAGHTMDRRSPDRLTSSSVSHTDHRSPDRASRSSGSPPDLSSRHSLHNPRLSPWRTGIAISITFVFGSAVVVLVMILLRIPLDQATACITALAINAAIDFSLYMVADYQSALLASGDPREALRYALPVKGKIIVIDVLLNSLCFAPLMTSRFIPVERMGGIMIVMLIACGCGALVLLPALLPWCVRNSGQSRSRTGRKEKEA